MCATAKKLLKRIKKVKHKLINIISMTRKIIYLGYPNIKIFVDGFGRFLNESLIGMKNCLYKSLDLAELLTDEEFR